MQQGQRTNRFIGCTEIADKLQESCRKHHSAVLQMPPSVAILLARDIRAGAADLEMDLERDPRIPLPPRKSADDPDRARATKDGNKA